MFCDELFSLEGKAAVVVGGGGVLGSAMARGLAQAGADIAILDPTCEKAIKSLKRELADMRAELDSMQKGRI